MQGMVEEGAPAHGAALGLAIVLGILLCSVSGKPDGFLLGPIAGERKLAALCLTWFPVSRQALGAQGATVRGAAYNELWWEEVAPRYHQCLGLLSRLGLL